MCIDGARDVDRMAAIEVLSIIEDYLACKGVMVPNEDRDEAVADGECQDELAVLYGEDYFRLEDKIAGALFNAYARVGDYE